MVVAVVVVVARPCSQGEWLVYVPRTMGSTRRSGCGADSQGAEGWPRGNRQAAAETQLSLLIETCVSKRTLQKQAPARGGTAGVSWGCTALACGHWADMEYGQWLPASTNILFEAFSNLKSGLHATLYSGDSAT